MIVVMWFVLLSYTIWPMTMADIDTGPGHYHHNVIVQEPCLHWHWYSNGLRVQPPCNMHFCCNIHASIGLVHLRGKNDHKISQIIAWW